MWLILIFVLLSIMNYAASTIMPFIGPFAPIYLSALITSTVWSGILLIAIWYGQGWARAMLAAFLVSFVLAQAVYFPDAVVYCPPLRAFAPKLLLLLFCANFFCAVLLLVSKDIRCLCGNTQYTMPPPM